MKIVAGHIEMELSQNNLIEAMQYMKKLLFLIFFSMSLFSVADELPYNKNTALNYLNSSDGVYLVMKVGGNLKFSEYKDYMKHYISVEEKLIENWKAIKNEKGERFLILKKYKGIENTGSIFLADNLAHYGTTILGGKYILFLDESDIGENSNRSFDDCDVFDLEKIPNDIQEKLDLLIGYISSSTLNPCLYNIEYENVSVDK